MKAENALLEIQTLMDGVEWTPDTLEAIAKVMEEAGYPIGDTKERSPTPSSLKGEWYFLLSDETDDDDGVERVTPIGSLVLIDQTFEGEDNYSVHCPATGGCFFMNDEEIRTLTMPVPTVYDCLPSTDGNSVMDRFTVFPAGEIEALKERYEYLGCSLGGRAASMWGELKLTDIKGDFSGLGRRVPFHELDVDTQRHIFNRLKD